MSKVADLMVTGPITANAEELVSDVARRLAANDVGAVIVVNGDGLLGVFSERDLAARVIAEGRDPGTTVVADVTTVGIVSVAPEDGLRTALDKFKSGKFRHLPVVKDGKPVGIICTRDLLATAIDRLESFIEQARFENTTAAGGDPYDHFGGSYGK